MVALSQNPSTDFAQEAKQRYNCTVQAHGAYVMNMSHCTAQLLLQLGFVTKPWTLSIRLH